MASGDDSDRLERAQFLWEEYKYRHDLIWQRVFRFTAAVVAISLVPYLQQDVVRRLGYNVLLAPLLATVLALFVLLVMRNELRLFKEIKDEYRRLQKVLYPEITHPPNRRAGFKSLVLSYLWFLLAASIANGLLVWLVWLPEVGPPIGSAGDLLYR